MRETLILENKYYGLKYAGTAFTRMSLQCSSEKRLSDESFHE